MSRNQLNPRRREIERRKSEGGAARDGLYETSRPGAPIDADRQPVKVKYDRTIRPDWSEPGQDGFNLTREVSDLRSRPDLLDGDREKAFLRMIETRAIRGPRDVWLSPSNQRRLAGICRRQIDPAWGAVWLRRQAELKAASEPASRGVESVNERGEFQLATFAYRR